MYNDIIYVMNMIEALIQAVLIHMRPMWILMSLTMRSCLPQLGEPVFGALWSWVESSRHLRRQQKERREAENLSCSQRQR